MEKFRKGGKLYHGEGRNAKEDTRSITGTGAIAVALDASKFDTFDIETSATGGADLDITITGASPGQRIIVRYLSGGAADTLNSITVNGTAPDLMVGETFNDSAENHLEIVVFSDSVSHYQIKAVA